MKNRKLSDWKVARENLLSSILRLQPDILQNDTLKFRLGTSANVAVVFKFGIVAFDRNDFLVLALNRSMPRDLAVRLVDALTKYCVSQEIKLGITPLDEYGKPIDTRQLLVIRV